MKFRAIKVPKYIFKDELGDFEFHDVEVLVDPSSDLTADAFDQEKTDYSISSKEIERMGREVAARFFNDTYVDVMKGVRSLTSREMNGIRLFLGLNGSELARLLRLDRSRISRYLSGEDSIQAGAAVLLMERMKDEIEFPGVTRVTLEKMEAQLRGGAESALRIRELRVPPLLVSEWLIREMWALGEMVTNLKLQKLLYYAQGLGFGRYGCKLMDAPIVAWEHGPVVEEVWRFYRGLGSGEGGAMPLPVDPGRDVGPLEKNKDVLRILADTLNKYGRFSAWVLRDKTHCESPWLETPRSGVISDEKMIAFFLRKEI